MTHLKITGKVGRVTAGFWIPLPKPKVGIGISPYDAGG